MSTEAPPTARHVAEALLLDGRQRGNLLGYAQSRFGIAQVDAEDLLQDTALELLRQRRYVEASPHGFVFAVFQARSRRFQWTHRRRSEVFAEVAEQDEAIPHPAGPVAYSGIAKTINRCLRRLRECLN